jgi:hypothetical protein
MIVRPPGRLVLGAAAAVAIVVASCGGTVTGPALTDPKAIISAALTSTQAAKSVHLDVTLDGTATVALPLSGGTGTPIDLTGTTAAADLDFAKPAARATVSVPTVARFAAELIAIDGKSYVKTSLTGPLYQASTAAGTATDPSGARTMITSLADVLLKPGVTLAKGGDVACGPKSCYTVTADLTPAQLGPTASGAVGGLPVDLSGATLKLTMRVEKDLPYHLAGVSAAASMPGNATLTVELTASKWDTPVSISAPPTNQVKTGS